MGSHASLRLKRTQSPAPQDPIVLPGAKAAANMGTTGQPAGLCRLRGVAVRGWAGGPEGKAALRLSQGPERLAELPTLGAEALSTARPAMCPLGGSPASIQLLPTAPKSGAHVHDWVERVEAQSWERPHVAKSGHTQGCHSRAWRKARESGFRRKRG